LKADRDPASAASRRIDQWLWFARFAKSRARAARLCTTGAVAVNGITVAKANYVIRIGDTIAVPQGGFRHVVRVRALGTRRGPALEARLLYEEAAASVRLFEPAPDWTPLLVDDDA
jgi:ribosome-associated heat shock protein Hsp15